MYDAGRKSNSAKNGPVAVIAVHGVADQGKGETAVIAANLMLHLNQVDDIEGEEPADGAYTGFEEEKIRVAVEPMDVSSLGDEDAWQYQLRRHLDDYEGEGSNGSYDTTRMEGHRYSKDAKTGERKPERPVHVYEMHWADVSRLKIGILNIFLGIYRLLFETSWIGQQTLGTWAELGQDEGKLNLSSPIRKMMLVFHTVASVILTRIMPVLYLMLISLLALPALTLIENPAIEGALQGLGGYPGVLALFLVFIVAGFLTFAASKIWRRIPWPPVYLVVAAASFLAWVMAFSFLRELDGSWWAESGVTLLSWGILCLGFWFFILPPLDARFPGTRLVGILLMLYLTGALFLGLLHPTEWPVLISAPLLALRMGFALMPFLWIPLASCANLFVILALVESVSLFLRKWAGKEVIQRKRARLRTALISITLPVLLISFLNSGFFLVALMPAKSGFLDGAGPEPGRANDAPEWIAVGDKFYHNRVEPFITDWNPMPSFEKWAEVNQDNELATFSKFIGFASKMMVVPFLEAIFLVVLLVLGYSVWTLAPAAIAENLAEKSEHPNRWRTLSRALGKNLSRGYLWLWFGQVLLAMCLLITQALFFTKGDALQAAESRGFTAGRGSESSTQPL